MDINSDEERDRERDEFERHRERDEESDREREADRGRDRDAMSRRVTGAESQIDGEGSVAPRKHYMTGNTTPGNCQFTHLHRNRG